MLAGRSWASSLCSSRHRQGLLLSLVSRLGAGGESSLSGGGGGAAAAASVSATMADSMATPSSPIENNGASRRSKSDLSALHHPPLVDVCIIGAVRTPIGGLMGSLSSLSATQLGGQAIAAALRAARIEAASETPSSSSNGGGGGGGGSLDVVDEVIMGNVLSAGLGQAPATQAAAFAGLPPTTPAYSVNKVCASGMKAVALAAAAISTGAAELAVAGGMESMSNAPFLLRSWGVRRGTKLGSLGEIEDGMMVDGLTCALSAAESCENGGGGASASASAEEEARRRRRSMGSIADAAASEAGVSREEQDWYALLSHARAKKAVEEAAAAAAAHAAEEEKEKKEGGGGNKARGATSSYYAWHGPEVVPVRVPKKSRGGADAAADDEFDLVSLDDAPARLDEARLLKLPPAFGPAGTATAGNASPISDGAAALVLCSSSAAAMRGARVLAHVAASADAQLPPERFPFAPAEAARRALRRAGVGDVAEVDLWEVNEAFSSVVLATARELFGPDRWRAEVERKVNVAGGAVALGHPLGASGAAAVVRLAHAMAARNVALGVATICNGGGGATAVVLRRSVREDGEPDDDE